VYTSHIAVDTQQRSATAIRSMAVDRIPNLRIEWDTPTVRYRRPSEVFVANAQVSGDVMMCRSGVTGEPTTREKGLS